MGGGYLQRWTKSLLTRAYLEWQAYVSQKKTFLPKK